MTDDEQAAWWRAECQPYLDKIAARLQEIEAETKALAAEKHDLLEQQRVMDPHGSQRLWWGFLTELESGH